jgi:hypothetical protein
MYTYLFIAALFLIVLLALNFDFLLLPNLAVVGLGTATLIVGAGIFLIGYLRNRKGLPRELESDPAVGRLRRSAGCLSAIVGSLYALTGIGIIMLQVIGYLALK